MFQSARKVPASRIAEFVLWGVVVFLFMYKFRASTSTNTPKASDHVSNDVDVAPPPPKVHHRAAEEKQPKPVATRMVVEDSASVEERGDEVTIAAWIQDIVNQTDVLPFSLPRKLMHPEKLPYVRERAGGAMPPRIPPALGHTKETMLAMARYLLGIGIHRTATLVNEMAKERSVDRNAFVAVVRAYAKYYHEVERVFSQGPKAYAGRGVSNTSQDNFWSTLYPTVSCHTMHHTSYDPLDAVFMCDPQGFQGIDSIEVADLFAGAEHPKKWGWYEEFKNFAAAHTHGGVSHHAAQCINPCSLNHLAEVGGHPLLSFVRVDVFGKEHIAVSNWFEVSQKQPANAVTIQQLRIDLHHLHREDTYLWGKVVNSHLMFLQLYSLGMVPVYQQFVEPSVGRYTFVYAPWYVEAERVARYGVNMKQRA
eukprot:PhM_4_TR14442/c0_g3_i1/m.28240